jgi:hypothetical protein
MKYAENLTNIIDKAFIKSITDELVDDNWRRFTDAQSLRSFTDHYKIMVSDYQELQDIKTAYPGFEDYLKILKVGPNGTWPISTVPNDQCYSVCIPIENPLLNISFFNECTPVSGVEDYIGDQFGYWESNPWATYYTGGSKVHTHILTDTSILDTSIPKQFINDTDTLCLFVLWKYHGNLEDFK